jgi:hypothetical protein
MTSDNNKDRRAPSRYIDSLIPEMHEDIKKMLVEQTRITSAIFDQNGNKGICSRVEIVEKSVKKLWLILAIVIGGGGGTVGIIELVKFYIGS